MRHIKFRAWYKDWDGVFRMSYSDRYEEDEIPTSAHQLMSYFFRNLSPDAQLMQYTGLKDKNGKEIYEGDIVKCFHDGDAVGNYDVIECNPGAFCFRYRFTTVLQWVDFDGQMEVIGNIFENHKLLTIVSPEQIQPPKTEAQEP